jgi:transposase
MRIKAVLYRAQGMKPAEIAIRTGFTRKYLSELNAKYIHGGIGALADNHYRGNRRNLSLAAETELIAGFQELAQKGQIVEVKMIKQAYEDKVGHKIGKGQIYRVLKRHGWRKVMPRGKHPKKATDEVIEASKKLTLFISP